MLVIGIAGGTGSGKTSVAKAIISKLGVYNSVLLSQDNYYLNHSHLSMEERENINYDHPHAFDNELLLNHIKALREGTAISMPVYDFTKHERSDRTIAVKPKSVVAVEGLHVLTDAQLRSALDIKVFVDTDPDIRILRRVVRDMNERGRSLPSICSQYLSTVKPMHDAFIEPSKKYADIIIPEGAHNKIGIHMITTLTEQYMKERQNPSSGNH
jgi:uridine kinase